MRNEFTAIRYEGVQNGVARIVLNRPERRNAQTRDMLYQLNNAFDLAAHDNEVRVIVLAAEGQDFCTGHDMGKIAPEQEYEPVGTWGGGDLPGPEGEWAREMELFVDLTWRWRNIPKPMIAEVQGRVQSAGLAFVWICDIVVASEEAEFSDPVVAYGVNGFEYFGHPWEFGVRKAKELLFTGDSLSAAECRELGMVNHVVPRSELTGFATTMAERIAKRPSMGLKLAKQSVNQAQDAMGIWSALQAAMSLQQLGHAHWNVVSGRGIYAEGADIIIEEAKARKARKKLDEAAGAQ